MDSLLQQPNVCFLVIFNIFIKNTFKNLSCVFTANQDDHNDQKIKNKL